jgi:hypothetical protein
MVSLVEYCQSGLRLIKTQNMVGIERPAVIESNPKRTAWQSNKALDTALLLLRKSLCISTKGVHECPKEWLVLAVHSSQHIAREHNLPLGIGKLLKTALDSLSVVTLMCLS